MSARVIGALMIVASSGLVSTPLLAAAKPEVAVRFDVIEASSRAHFQSELSALKTQVEARIVQELKQRIYYLDFSNRTRAPCQLLFTLEEDAAASLGPEQKKLDISIKVTGRDIKNASVRWDFRSLEGFGRPMGDADTFTEEVATKFTDGNVAKLIGTVLSSVPITATGEFLGQSIRGWVTPFLQSDLCMDRGSTLETNSEIDDDIIGSIPRTYSGEAMVMHPPAGSPLAAYQGRIFTSLDGDSVLKEDLLKYTPDKFRLKAIFVKTYTKSQTVCNDLSAPDSQDFSGGGHP